MEDRKLEAYYMQLKNAAPRGRKGALGFTGSRRAVDAGDKEIDYSKGEGVGHNGLPNNPLYRSDIIIIPLILILICDCL